jgi:hypothetical protein
MSEDPEQDDDLEVALARLPPRPARKSDESLAWGFLCGTVAESSNGAVSHGYLARRDADAAQAALVRLLRNHSVEVPYWLRSRLGSLFDPSSSDDRRLLVQWRKRGEHGEGPFIHLAIARFVGERLAAGDEMKQAISKAMKTYPVSESTVWRAWNENKDGELILKLLNPNG